MAEVVQNTINISFVVDWFSMAIIAIVSVVAAGLVKRWTEKSTQERETLYLTDEQMDMLLEECKEGR